MTHSHTVTTWRNEVEGSRIKAPKGYSKFVCLLAWFLFLFFFLGGVGFGFAVCLFVCLLLRSSQTEYVQLKSIGKAPTRRKGGTGHQQDRSGIGELLGLPS